MQKEGKKRQKEKTQRCPEGRSTRRGEHLAGTTVFTSLLKGGAGILDWK